MKNKLVRYLVIMFISFVIDSILRFYLPSSILKIKFDDCSLCWCDDV
ncbi:hypothetical protein [Faecalibacillus intestinalis]